MFFVYQDRFDKIEFEGNKLKTKDFLKELVLLGTCASFFPPRVCWVNLLSPAALLRKAMKNKEIVKIKKCFRLLMMSLDRQVSE